MQINVQFSYIRFPKINEDCESREHFLASLVTKQVRKWKGQIYQLEESRGK